MRHMAVFEGSDEGGWSGYFPSVPGCVAAAPTYEECRSLLRNAYFSYLEREADESIARGEIKVFDSVEDFIAALELES